jgi:hypothetical protein
MHLLRVREQRVFRKRLYDYLKQLQEASTRGSSTKERSIYALTGIAREKSIQAFRKSKLPME